MHLASSRFNFSSRVRCIPYLRMYGVQASNFAVKTKEQFIHIQVLLQCSILEIGLQLKQHTLSKSFSLSLFIGCKRF